MLDKLQAIKHRWEDIGEQMNDPVVVMDHKRFAKLSKEYKDLQELVQAHDNYANVLSNIANNKDMLRNESDEELKEMAKMELSELEDEQILMEEKIKVLLIPKDPDDDKNAIIEIRAGTGGDEAGIFAGDLHRMYVRFCEKQGWRTGLLSVSESQSGGYKEIVMQVEGTGVYGMLKYESGVHRVQRVPVTESQGRVHTSAATVAILPEVDDDVVIDINPADLRVDTYRASGAGGQHVNKTESAVRITHVPTGIVAECQKERSQHRNKDVAMQMLRTRMYEVEHKKHLDAIASERKTLVSTGDRSAKIRTYNYPQGRVTDHRIGLTLYKLQQIIGGDVGEVIEQLQMVENAEKLKSGT